MIWQVGIELKVLCVDGGFMKNQFLMQFQVDMLYVVINCLEIEEVFVLGVVVMNGFVCKKWVSF